jgi:hypothetical protein
VPELIHGTRAELPGPWLIDRDSLTAFDKLMTEEGRRLRSVREVAFAEAVVKEAEERKRWRSSDLSPEDLSKIKSDAEDAVATRYPYRAEKRTITIFFSTGKRVKASSFEEASRMIELACEVANGFKAEYECGAVTAEIETSAWPHLVIRVSPENDQDSKEMYAVLRNWASSTRPTRFQQFQGWVWPYHWSIWLGILAVASMVMMVVVPDRGAPYRAQGRAMVEKGLRPGDELKAIEVILAIESRYSTPTQEQQMLIPHWLTAVFWIGVVSCSILTVRPRVLLGIGKGEGRIKFWRAYDRIVRVTLPLFLISSFITPAVVEAVKQWF